MTTVMIVEDEFIVAQDLEASLSKMGYNVCGCFESGENAMRQAQEERPDLVIMDIILKGEMDGIEAARKMNEQLGIPIVFLTAFANQALLERAKLIEPYGYLIKPFSTNELKSAIEIGLYKAGMESKLRASEKRFRNMADLLPSAICETDTTQRITFINKTGMVLFKLSGADVARGVYLSELLKSDDQADVQDHFARVLEGKTAGPAEYRITDARRAQRSIIVNSAPVWESGTITGIRSGWVDITEIKRLQTQLKQAWKMEAIATLAGGLAHEFNNALTVIFGSVEMLKSSYPGNNDIENYAKGIMASTNRMAALTNQMLAYAREGKYDLQSDSLNNFVRKAFALFEPSLNPDIEVKFDLGDDVALVKIDTKQFQFIANALLTNACEALQSTGEIWIRTENRVVNDEMAKLHMGLYPGLYTCLLIRDNGPGMDDEVRQRIFEPFFSTKFQGRGMGMAAVYGIVKNHEGWIGIESTPGEGTQVTVFFPEIK